MNLTQKVTEQIRSEFDIFNERLVQSKMIAVISSENDDSVTAAVAGKENGRTLLDTTIKVISEQLQAECSIRSAEIFNDGTEMQLIVRVDNEDPENYFLTFVTVY